MEVLGPQQSRRTPRSGGGRPSQESTRPFVQFELSGHPPAVRRDETLDYLRAYAIALVVLVHAAGPPLYGFNDVPRTLWWTANLYDSFARTCVPLFVMLSGYLLLDPSKSESIGHFFKKRLTKVLVPYLFWSAVYLAWRTWFHHEPMTSRKVVTEFLNGTAYYHILFLMILIGLYLSTPILRVFVRAADSATQFYALGLWFVVVGIFTCVNRVSGIAISSHLQVTSLFFGHYLFGAICRRVQPKLGRTAVLGSVVLLLCAVALTAILTYHYTRKNNGILENYFYAYFSPNVVIMSMISFVLLLNLRDRRWPTRLNFLSAVARWIGSASFGIFLTHVLVLETLTRGTFGFALTPTTFHAGVSIPLIASVTLILSAFVTVGIRRLPIIRWIIP